MDWSVTLEIWNLDCLTQVKEIQDSLKKAFQKPESRRITVLEPNGQGMKFLVVVTVPEEAERLESLQRLKIGFMSCLTENSWTWWGDTNASIVVTLEILWDGPGGNQKDTEELLTANPPSTKVNAENSFLGVSRRSSNERVFNVVRATDTISNIVPQYSVWHRIRSQSVSLY